MRYRWIWIFLNRQRAYPVHLVSALLVAHCEPEYSRRVNAFKPFTLIINDLTEDTDILGVVFGQQL